MVKQKDVAILVLSTTAFEREVRRGIGRYARTHSRWMFHVRSGDFFRRIENVAAWKGNGVIAMMGSAQGYPFADTDLAVVNVSSRPTGFPQVCCDNHAIGRLAAEHLMRRGFANLGFYGYPADFAHSEERWEGFRDAAADEGLAPAFCRMPDWDLAVQENRLLEWLASLQRPTAVFAADDKLAKVVADACWSEGLAVPEQVAILGADNDEPLLAMTNPPLSSVDVDGVRVGYEAAALLDRLMAGEPAPDAPLRIPPRGIVTRQSTEILAIDDPLVADAIHYIRNHRAEPITVARVVREIAVSRRALERRFKRHLGRTPWREIRRSQIEHVKQLLRETDMPIQEVAETSAFCDPRRLSTIFREETGETPTAFRHRHRSRS